MNWLIFVFVFCCGSVFVTGEKVMVCYFSSWAIYRHGLGRFTVDNVNTDLCSHVVYAFVGIDHQGNIISLDPYLDLDSGNGNFRKFTNLKQKNPNIKTLLAVGGWNEGSYKYSIMAANPTFRQNFIQSSLKMLQEYNFDGLDVDWEYPNRRDTLHGAADVDNFTLLLKELKEEFDKRGWLLTSAVSAVKASAEHSYDIPEISKYLDFIHIMTYDMSTGWDPLTGHNSPLHKGESDTGNREDQYTVDVAVEYWLGKGCPASKLVLGMPLYGRTFTLSNAAVNGVRAPAIGPGLSGPFTSTPGFMGYNEICDKLRTETWNVKYDSLAKVPYATQGAYWVSYDDADSITKKTEFANSFNLAGGMVWSIETDDFNNVCGNGDFPLLRAINYALGRNVDGVVTEKPYTSSTEASTTTKKPDANTTTKEPNTTSEQPEIVTDEPTTSSEEVNVDSTEASTPAFACKEEGLTSNPEDCSSFYMCVKVNGEIESRLFPCPATTYWDQANLICNYKDEVQCHLN